MIRDRTLYTAVHQPSRLGAHPTPLTGWELRKEGAARASKTAGTKDELLKITGTFKEGKTASVKIHKKDGVIQEERTYPRAADPRETEG